MAVPSRAGQAARRAQGDFCYPRGVYIAFYVLVVIQLALGAYSLWQGIEWYAMVRRRMNSHTGFYAPVAAVICPCKGNELGLEDNLSALAKFDYPNYELYIVLATSLDPALKVIERVKAASPRPFHIVIAGPGEDCGEKVYNLRRAVEALPEPFEVFVFTDSDVRLPRGWLTKLVAPLQDPRVGATTAYRWIIPSRRIGDGGFASAMASAWNASIATMLGRARENFCWGGGTAIRKSNFKDAHVLQAWHGAVSDDLALTSALEQSGKEIVFCAECLAATLHPWTGKDLVEFTNRQISIAHVYSPKRWALGAAAHLGYSLTLIYTLVTEVTAMVSGDPWGQLLLMAAVIPLLAAIKGAIRTVAVWDLLPEWKAELNRWGWVWTVLAPVTPFLFAWNFLVSIGSKTIRWRGIRYQMISPSMTRVLRR
jgi:ceramide glucosyltransferase